MVDLICEIFIDLIVHQVLYSFCERLLFSLFIEFYRISANECLFKISFDLNDRFLVYGLLIDTWMRFKLSITKTFCGITDKTNN